MENIKELFASIRKGLENFSAHLTHSTQLYHTKSKTLASGQAFSAVSNPSRNGAESEAVTTLGTSLESFVKAMLDMAKDVL